MILSCFVALLPWLCGAAPTGDGIKVSVRSLVPVQTGQSTTLPCWLDPPRSAEGLEIQWKRNDQHDSLIIVYKESKIVYAGQNTPYEGRVSFGTKDAASGGLASGDLSLRLVNVTVDDAADYRCYVSGDQDYDFSLITLAVYKIGGPVFLSAVWRDYNTVNVICESGGWYPEPRLQWSDSKGALTAMSLKHSRDSSGLVSVHSWILVSSSSKISCSVGVDGGEAKEASVYLANSSQHGDQCSGSGWVAFTVLLIANLAALGLLWFKMRGKEQPVRGEGRPANHQSEVSGSKTTEAKMVEQKEKLFDASEGKTTEAKTVEREEKQLLASVMNSTKGADGADVDNRVNEQKKDGEEITLKLEENGAETLKPEKNGAETSKLEMNGAETLKPEENGAETLTPEKKEAETLKPEKNGAETLKPEKNGAETLTPEKKEAETLKPEENGAETLKPEKNEAETLKPEENGAEALKLEKNGAETLTPEKNGAETLKPEKNGAETLKPEKNGAETLKPEKNEAETLTPEKNGAETLKPEENGAETLKPEKNGAETLKLEKNGAETLKPEENGAETLTPEENGAETLTPEENEAENQSIWTIKINMARH